jgi:DNA-binding response OmpR family regulator
VKESASGAKILLVDDEAAITANLAPFLERAGFAVRVASDGEKALHRAADSTPDLIVLDVLMPRLDGRQVCRRLRAAGNWTPIIMLTQVGSPAERAMSLEEGAADRRLTLTLPQAPGPCQPSLATGTSFSWPCTTCWTTP